MTSTTNLKRSCPIHVANGGVIPSEWLYTYAVETGRADVAGRIADICSGRYLRYSGEDYDVMGSCWTALGWPRGGEVSR